MENYMKGAAMEEEISNIQHAFWDLVAVLADNLPEEDPYETDPETAAWASGCRERFEADKEEFDSAMKALKAKVQS